MRVSDVISNVTKQNKTWMSWRQGTKLRVRLSLANARFASLLLKVMYIIKRKFKCLSWIWLLFHLMKWKKMYISFVPSALMKYTFFHSTRWNKSHIHSKHLNILYILVMKIYVGHQSVQKTKKKSNLKNPNKQKKRTTTRKKHFNVLFRIFHNLFEKTTWNQVI